MARLIDRDALLKACEEAQKSDPQADNRGWSDHFLNSAGEPSAEWWAIEDMIESQPIINAAPVVHGRWVKIDVHVWKCSICGEEDCFAYIWREVKIQDDLFCPHCGANMDGGEES